MVVLDELHMVDEDNRGYLLELIATKLLSLEQCVQLIGMSATLSVSINNLKLSNIVLSIDTLLEHRCRGSLAQCPLLRNQI